MHPEPSPHVATISPIAVSCHEACYAIRQLGNGEWSVERGDGEVGGIFVNLGAALRFARSDLETAIVTHDVRRAA